MFGDSKSAKAQGLRKDKPDETEKIRGGAGW